MSEPGMDEADRNRASGGSKAPSGGSEAPADILDTRAVGGRPPAPRPPPPDDENPALIDAFKTFRYTWLGAVGFAAVSAVIIILTRWG